MSDLRDRGSRLISFHEAQEIILARCRPGNTRRLPLLEACGSYLAEDLRAPFAIPRYDHSAVDGFAVRIEDLAEASVERPVRLRIIGTVKTGQAATCEVERQTTIRVFTGAMLPPSANGVVMVEDVMESAESIHVCGPLKQGKNIRRRGEEFSEGDRCIASGIAITPPVIGLAASLGVESLLIHEPPRVAVVVTGSELVTPGAVLGAAQIYDSNSFALSAALEELGITPFLLHCEDDEAALREQIAVAIEQADVVITSGGASVGDVDYVKPVVRELGGKIHFEKVAIKPGKPTIFAEFGSKLLFGLPGNPVSALVTFMLFVAPALRKLRGATHVFVEPQIAVLGETIRKRSSRTEFVRAITETRNGQNVVFPCRGQESHMLGGLAAADSLIIFEGEAGELAQGSPVQALPIRWT